MKKFVSMLIFTTALATCYTGSASAQGSGSSSGYGGNDGNSASVSVASPNSKVRIRFNGFRAYSRVKLTFHSEPVFLGEFVADERGEIDIEATIPSSAELGEHLFIAEGIDVNGQPTQSQIATRVEAGNLAFTGSNTGNVLALAGLLIVFGFAGMAAARRRLEPSHGFVDSLGGSPTRFRA